MANHNNIIKFNVSHCLSKLQCLPACSQLEVNMHTLLVCILLAQLRLRNATRPFPSPIDKGSGSLDYPDQEAWRIRFYLSEPCLWGINVLI